MILMSPFHFSIGFRFIMGNHGVSHESPPLFRLSAEGSHRPCSQSSGHNGHHHYAADGTWVECPRTRTRTNIGNRVIHTPPRVWITRYVVMTSMYDKMLSSFMENSPVCPVICLDTKIYIYICIVSMLNKFVVKYIHSDNRDHHVVCGQLCALGCMRSPCELS